MRSIPSDLFALPSPLGVIPEGRARRVLITSSVTPKPNKSKSQRDSTVGRARALYVVNQGSVLGALYGPLSPIRSDFYGVVRRGGGRKE